MRLCLVVLALIGIGCGSPSRSGSNVDVYDVLVDHFESACGNGRWNVKTGTDEDAVRVTKQPVDTSIADLLRLSPGTGPVEFTIWRLTNVSLVHLDFTWDEDAVLTLSDGSSNLTAALPSQSCVKESSPFRPSIAIARAALPAADQVVTVLGVGFIDSTGRVGLHPVLGVCAGRDCQPR